MNKSSHTCAWTVKKLASTALIGLVVIGAPVEVSAQAQKKSEKPKTSQKSQAKSSTQKKSEQKKSTQKSSQKKNDTKKSTAKKSDGKKVATQPSKDGKGVIPVNAHSTDSKTLLEQQTPTEEELSVANKELLAKNAELERQVNVLTNQNNVLTQEKSGQLFMYGTMTSIFSVILGGLVVKLFGGRKERW